MNNNSKMTSLSKDIVALGQGRPNLAPISMSRFILSSSRLKKFNIASHCHMQ